VERLFIKGESMEKSHRKYSVRNLEHHLEKWKKRKDKRHPADVQLAMDCFFCFHASKQVNIKSILLDGWINIKKNILGAHYTNNATDYMQGFHNHLSMSIGEPWLEYGKYVFIFHIDKIDDEALFFFKDPWKYDATELANNFMYKEDFITFQKFLQLKNLMRMPLTKDHYMPNIFFLGPLSLLRYNCKFTEVKQPKDLNIHESDEIQIYSEIDYYLIIFAKIFLNPIILIPWCVLLCWKTFQWARCCI
jgi:hypothetical protein